MSYFFIFIAVFYLALFAFAIASYILQGIGLMTMAKKLMIANPWMSFIPVAQLYLLGKIAEFDVKPGATPRKWGRILLTLSVIPFVILIVFYVFLIFGIIFLGFTQNGSSFLESSAVILVIALLIFCLVIIGLSIAAVIVQYLCIYKTYHLFLPANAVPMLILSILFPIVFSFTVFLNRNNTPVIYNGMPPWQQNGYGGYNGCYGPYSGPGGYGGYGGYGGT